MSHDDPRPAPETFLPPAYADQGNGRLKIFLGASPGVGKTYAMLEEARAVRIGGMDVVVALAETHGRPETQALLDGLEQLPRRIISYRSRQLSEMDIDGLLARKPQLALIDELAHSNVPGSRHPKRWQDVEEVLQAGIDVYTTLNIQHIESLNDIVARITGVRVQETIPDSVLQRADEILMIDLPADDLIRRMHEGKVYMPVEAGRALLNFFSRPNLTALRELALRTAASRVDAEMLALTRGSGRNWAQDRLMVCLESPEGAKALVRAGRRMTDRARIPWVVATVITPQIERRGYEASGAMADALVLAEQLGAEVRILRADQADVVAELLATARKMKVSRLIVGRVGGQNWPERLRGWLRRPLSRRLLEQAADFEVTVLPLQVRQTLPPTPSLRLMAGRQWLLVGAQALAVTGLATLIALLFVGVVPVASLALIYLVGVLSIGMRHGTGGAVLASVLSFLAYNFFFTAPLHSLHVTSQEAVVALLVFTVSALFTGSLAGRLKRQVEFMRSTQVRTEMLYDFSRKLALANTTDDVLWAAVAHIAHSLECNSLIMMPDQTGELQQLQGFPAIEEDLTPQAFAAALWAFRKNMPAGAGTDTLPGADWMFVPLTTQAAPLGVIGLRFLDPSRARDPETRRLLAAVEDQVSVAVERLMIESRLELARLDLQAEALLGSVGHDLRPLLAKIISSLAALGQQGEQSMGSGPTLIRNAMVEAKRLDRYAAGLSSLMRSDHEGQTSRRIPADLGALIGKAQGDLAHLLTRFRLVTDLPEGLPAVMVDPDLIGQVLRDLLDHVASQAPEGSAIHLSATRQEDRIALVFQHEGAPIPPLQRARFFDLFHPLDQGDGAPVGGGIGLAIIRAMAEASQGQVEVIDPPLGRGAAIRLLLPLAADRPIPVSSGRG